MFRAAVRAIVSALVAALVLPASAVAASNPNPHLGEILAEPPTDAYVELQSHTPGVLEGPFDAGEYASIGASEYGTTLNTLRNDGFVAGYGRAWVQQSPSRVLVEIVVAFSGDKGAKAWLSQSQQADLSDPTFQHAISVDGIENYYGARMSDSSSYFADAFLFVKGNDGFLVSTISATDDLGDSAANQTRVQYERAPAYTIPPEGWPGAAQRRAFTISDATLLAARITIGLLAGAGIWWLLVIGVRRRRKRRPYLSSGL